MAMDVAYLTLFEFSTDHGRYARMHDIFRSIDRCEPNFDIRVIATIRDDDDEIVLSRAGFTSEDLWGSRLHNVEAALASRRTVNELLSYDPDILHVVKGHPAEAIVARIVADRLDIPVVCGPNLGQWYPTRPDKFWEETTTDKALNRLKLASRAVSLRVLNPDLLLTFSGYHETMLRSVWDGRIETLLPAVHDGFSPGGRGDRETDLLYVGDLSEQKGYDVLTDVLDLLDGERDLRVDIIGGAPETRPEFETLDVRYHGFVPREELPEFYTGSKLFVCLSADEMGPNTLVEALSCGTPALVNDVSGVREYLRGGNGVRCDRSDVDDVKTTLLECLEGIDELIENAEREAESYDICRAIRQLERLYHSLTENRS